MINYAPLSTASVLAALYNASRPQGMGFMAYEPSKMTEIEAATLLDRTKYFDYLKGRVMKVDLSKPDQFEERLYDRDNGQGAAQAVIDALRANNQQLISDLHKSGVQEAAERTMQSCNKATTISGNDIVLGLASVPQLPAKVLDALMENDN